MNLFKINFSWTKNALLYFRISMKVANIQNVEQNNQKTNTYLS